jgi:hypothetical protein
MSALFRLGFLVALAPLFAVSTAGAEPEPAKNELPPAVQAVLDKASTVELLSLDPAGIAKTDDVPEKDRFHGYRVLGRTTLKDADPRKAVLAALDKGIKDSDGKVARCFNPRHGIRASADGKSVDLVICFECLQIQAYQGEVRNGGALTTRSPQPLFDKTLRDAGAELAPQP